MSMYKLRIRVGSELERGKTLVEVGQDTNQHKKKDTVELLQLRLNRLQNSVLDISETLSLLELL